MGLAAQREIVVWAHTALDFPGKGSIAVHVDRLLLVAAPPGSERRACGGVSIAKGDADPEDEDDGQQATPQASKEPREGRSRRSAHSGAQPPACTPTAHSTGPVKVHGDPDRFSSPGGGCGSRRSLRGHRTVEEPDAVAAASGFTI